MEPGTMRHRVALQQRSTTKDRFGHEVNTWTTVNTLYANVKPIGVRERMRANVADSTVTHTVVVRYAAALKPIAKLAAMRLLYDSRLFNINGAIDLNEEHEFLVLECTEGSEDGQ